MNALANSQLGELDKFINAGYPDHRGPVRFRRYTGQEFYLLRRRQPEEGLLRQRHPPGSGHLLDRPTQRYGPIGNIGGFVNKMYSYDFGTANNGLITQIEDLKDATKTVSYPYGEQWLQTGGSGNEHRYTGHLRDTESGNDYAGARYYSNVRARWLSVDALLGILPTRSG